MSQPLQSLPGFRDLLPRECAVRNYIFDSWRAVACRYGFFEWEGPAVEATDLYRRKSGDEITRQLFAFTDKGDREVALRPELTPTLARVMAAGHRNFKKPIKWFQIGPCYRYEAPQKGRLREFNQWNCDIVGEASTEADAELIAIGIDSLRQLGFTDQNVAVRISNRHHWDHFLDRQDIDRSRAPEFLQVIDKWERESEQKLETRLAAFGTTRAAVAEFIDSTRGDESGFDALLGSLEARGLRDYARIDPGIVRGLAYYTGTVFEFSALEHESRAIAGGGRYDGLCALVSGGATDLPAAGFAMGDVVLTDLIGSTPAANARLHQFLSEWGALDLFIVVADESRRPNALAALETLRESGWRVDYAMTPAKVGRQFQIAESLKARAAVIFGSEFPTIKVKDLVNREETIGHLDNLSETIRAILATPPRGPLMA